MPYSLCFTAFSWKAEIIQGKGQVCFEVWSFNWNPLLAMNMPTWGNERGSEEGITKGKGKWWPRMQISGFSLLSSFRQFGFSSSPLYKFYNCEVFRVCWIFLSSSPDLYLLSTFLQAALCRGNQLQQITWTRLLRPLTADGYSHWEEEARDLGVGGDRCPATWQWLFL